MLLPKHDKQGFVARMLADLTAGIRHNKLSAEKLAATFGIQDRTEVKEFTELAIVLRARELAHAPGTIRERFESIVALYELQANLSHRTSQSVLLQQYSTPAPIGYLAGVFCGIDRFRDDDARYFEPSAGNGLLTIAGDPWYGHVNEVDDVRRHNLEYQKFRDVKSVDASQPLVPIVKSSGYEAVMTNPPFGTVDISVDYDSYKISSLEQLMALRALDCMKNTGRCAIIIGGHTSWDAQGRIQAGKNRIFLNYLYSHYNVADVINIEGKKLYTRQGTGFNVRLILIAGRKPKAEAFAPLRDPAHDKVVNTFDELFERVSDAIGAKTITTTNDKDMKRRAQAAKANMDMLELEMSLGGTTSSNGANRFSIAAFNALSEELQNRIDVISDERGFGDGIWIYLADEWYNPRTETHAIHEDSIGECISQLKDCVRDSDLGMAYSPSSTVGKSLQTQVPDSMAFETHEALRHIAGEVGGDVDNFVRDRLGYATMAELGDALSAEQIDAVAMAIYNIEGRHQGMIIGDQTGIGKGRVAAAMIRYAHQQRNRCIFLTEKPNLFSDIYRDLKAIGSAELVPFIVNGRESKTDIKDEDGVVVHTALAPAEQHAIFESGVLPKGFDFIVGTYSQFNSVEKKPTKPVWLSQIAAGSVMVMDEAHNSSGSSNVGAFLKEVVKSSKGVMFLSATFAKRPDNMPIYAMKTCMADCALSDEDLVTAIEKGGVALQEVISSQLVSEGQMLRRERSYEGIEVNYLTMEDMAQEHRAVADVVTSVIRRIIAFQLAHVAPAVKAMDKIAAAEGSQAEARKGTAEAGVNNSPYFSKVFNVINQMLFAIKAEAVADRAIMRLKQGKKPVIAFSSTMGAFLETMGTDGEVIKADFSEVLSRGLDSVMKITVIKANGERDYQRISLNDLEPDGLAEYHSIYAEIEKVSTGLCISPIDILIEKIKSAGYSVAEVTGRKLALKLSPPKEGYSLNGVKAISKADWLNTVTRAEGRDDLCTYRVEHPGAVTQAEPIAVTPALTGMIYARKKENTNDAFRRFNNNEVDVLLINQSGSTGASAHAVPTSKVPASEVKQRVMIVLQAELDINTEVQKRGRINRTGQIIKPIYDYLTSAIPAEQRLMMMLQKKLKSLDANTASNQKQSSSMLDVPDFLNKYGNEVVKEFLMDTPEINELLDDPLKIEKKEEDGTGSDKGEAQENAAQKVSGRVAVLSTDMQKTFYDDVADRYNARVEYLKAAGEYDLEMEAMNLQAETVRTAVISVGNGGGSPFGENVILETVNANVLRKPYTGAEIHNIIIEALAGQDAKELQAALVRDFTDSQDTRLDSEITAITAKYDKQFEDIAESKAIQKITDDAERRAAIAEMKEKVREAAEAALNKVRIRSRNIGASLLQLFKFFHIGRVCSYPIATMGAGIEHIPAVFLGYIIDRRKANPYVPSAVKLRFAIANGIKYMELPASMYKEVSPFMMGSSSRQYHGEALVTWWDESTKGSHAARKVRYIATGNLLQALGVFEGKGRLISYTTSDGGEKKGLLMPESWQPDDRKSGSDKVTVPIGKATSIIKSVIAGQNIKCSNGLIIAKQYDDSYKLYVPASKQAGGDIYLDQELQEHILNNIWDKQSDKMVTYVSAHGIDGFLEVFALRHPCTVPVAKHQLSQVNVAEHIEQRTKRHYHITPPAPAPAVEPQSQSTAMRARAAKALMEMLELELSLDGLGNLKKDSGAAHRARAANSLMGAFT